MIAQINNRQLQYDSVRVQLIATEVQSKLSASVDPADYWIATSVGDTEIEGEYEDSEILQKAMLDGCRMIGSGVAYAERKATINEMALVFCVVFGQQLGFNLTSPRWKLVEDVAAAIIDAGDDSDYCPEAIEEALAEFLEWSF